MELEARKETTNNKTKIKLIYESEEDIEEALKKQATKPVKK